MWFILGVLVSSSGIGGLGVAGKQGERAVFCSRVTFPNKTHKVQAVAEISRIDAVRSAYF